VDGERHRRKDLVRFPIALGRMRSNCKRLQEDSRWCVGAWVDWWSQMSYGVMRHGHEAEPMRENPILKGSLVKQGAWDDLIRRVGR
jgi:hypothetical protein